MTQYSFAAFAIGFIAFAMAFYVSEKRALAGWFFSSVLGIFAILFVFPGHFWIPGAEALHDWALPVVKGVFAGCWGVGMAIASTIFHEGNLVVED